MKTLFRKIIILLIVAVSAAACASCGEKTPTPEEEGIVPYEQITIPSGVDCDIDLTAVNVAIKNSKVFDILVDHDKYAGKTVKVDGRFKVVTHNGVKKFACEFVNAEDEFDQFLEFILEGDKKYPDDYPKKGEDIVVVGTLQKYEGGIHLINEKIVKEEAATTTETTATAESGAVTTGSTPSSKEGTEVTT
ncbi:MAG: hypothetical protein IJS94_05135, partial [Clostridia bacterium]|nr:hypothetical protein [Clostridia bacterium]